MCAKKKHRTGNDFLRYLKDELSGRERHDLEKGLEADPFEKEAMEGLQSIPPEKAEEDLLALHASLGKRLKRKTRYRWYAVAATIASIMIVGSVFLNIYDLNPREEEILDRSEEAFSGTAPETEAEIETETEAEAEIETEMAPADEEPAIKKILAEPETAEELIEEPEPMEAVPEKDLLYMKKADVQPEDETELDIVIMEAGAVEEEQEEAVPLFNQSDEKRSRAKTAESPQPQEALQGQVSGVAVSERKQEPMPGVHIVSDKVEDDSLDEVVLIAYGAEDKSSTKAGAISTIDPDEQNPDYRYAEPDGGFAAFKRYIQENMVFPEEYTPGKREVVVLKFTVLSNGNISAIEVMRSAGEAYTLEALRLVREGPVWIPAQRKEESVDEQVRVRIVFKKQ